MTEHDVLSEQGSGRENLSARLPGFGQPFELVASPVPSPGRGEVVVRVSHVGVCGSELHYLSDPEEVEADPDLTRLGFLGHEYSGVVERVGEDVLGWTKGTPVVGLARQACGACARCLATDPTNCVDQWRPSQRAYARYTTVRAAMLRAIPEGVDLRLAALATPLAECLHSLEAAGWRAGSNALVVGAGPMGLCTTALLLHGGASLVVVTEPNEERRALAASLGAVAVHPDEGLETAKRLSGANGIDVAFESVGSVAAFDTSMSLLRVGGCLVLIGLAPWDARYDLKLRELWHRRISIVVGGAPETTMDRALRLLPVVGAERLITGEFPLAQVGEAFTAAPRHAGKVLVAAWAPDGNNVVESQPPAKEQES